MGIRTRPPAVFSDADDDFESVTLRFRTITDGNSPTRGLEVRVIQRSSGGALDDLDESDLLADIPAAALGGITKVQFRRAVKGLVDRARTKGGIV